MTRQIILSSSSPSRRALLKRLGLAFTSVSPDVDETPLPNEKASDLVHRLAIVKAQKSATQYPDALIIGADQVGTLNEVTLGKPLTFDNAVKQLELVSGKTVRFYTGICLQDSATQQYEAAVETYDVTFRTLSHNDIVDYLNKENALQCAGSFQVEGLGITLIQKLHGDDYTALIGLPLIRLTTLLKKHIKETSA